MLLGSFLGGLRGSLIGSLVGAFIGDFVERRLFGNRGPTGSAERPYGRRTGSYRDLSDARRAQIFSASAAAMLAKLAKADGRVSQREIAVVEQAFARLGFDARTRTYAINVFRKAKDDRHTIYEYASEFAAVVQSVELRELFYELLWDLACADGFVGATELEILQRITFTLGIRPALYLRLYHERLRTSDWSERGGRRGAPPPADPLADAYATLGISASCTDDEAKRAYRELAKRNHPDALRAQGLPDAMVAKANEKMGRINAAWKEVREARGL